MKTKTTRKKSDGVTTLAPACAVRLEVRDPGATSVCVAGTFNDWHPADAPLTKQADGFWSKEIILPPGRHEYLFVVDGQWCPDPAASEQVGNPFGGQNSVLRVQG